MDSDRRLIDFWLDGLEKAETKPEDKYPPIFKLFQDSFFVWFMYFCVVLVLLFPAVSYSEELIIPEIWELPEREIIIVRPDPPTIKVYINNYNDNDFWFRRKSVFSVSTIRNGAYHYTIPTLTTTDRLLKEKELCSVGVCF